MIDLTKLYERSPKQDKIYDVIVAGSGPAAIGASIAAAINGASVLILEAKSQFCGTATSAMWMYFNWLYHDNDYNTRGGVNKILADMLEKTGPDAAIRGNKKSDARSTFLTNSANLSIHPEYLKNILFDLFEQYEIDYSLYSPVVDVEKDGNRVCGVIVQNREAKVKYQGKIVIDSTGDGDVAFKAGCEMENCGSAASGWRAPMTVLFALINVDRPRFWEWARSEKIVLQGMEFARVRDVLAFGNKAGYFIPMSFTIYHGTVPGVVNFNYRGTRNWHFDGLDSYDLTLIEKTGIIQASEFLRFARDYDIPGLEKAELLRTGAYASIRETRRLVGEYVFSVDDLMNGTEFPDVVTKKYGSRDPMGDENPRIDIMQGAQYPYRSFLPKIIDGLLVAGRCGSATFDGHYGGKSMGNMMAMGQAAGVAAALCVKNNCQPRVLDYALIQKKLDDMGVIL